MYITTAIDYVNSSPHLGHAYEKVCADVIARWWRLQGKEVFLLIGTDENAQKNAQAAKKAGVPTKEFVDKNVEKFKELAKVLWISNNSFIRTTDPAHVKAAQELFKLVHEKGDIYKGKYSGWYCFGCEAFYTEKDLRAGKCPVHESKPEWLEEESYFFRMGKYQKQLLGHIKKNPGFIQPGAKRNEILNRLAEPLKDLSISRPKLDWGVPVPIEKGHVLYVWMDALANYITALGWPHGELYKKHWPADIHLIGRDIAWFHCVIWPTMLMSAGIPLPKSVYSHGFINAADGRKMSKTLGNVVDPFEMVRKYGADAFRYFLLRDIAFGEDGSFSEEALASRINGELVSDLGNLLNRVLSIQGKNAGVKIEGKPVLDGKLNLKKIGSHMEKLELHLALEEILVFVRAANKYVNEKEVWKLEGKGLGDALYNLLEALRVISILVGPFMPQAAEEMQSQLGVGPGLLKDCKFEPWKGKPKKGGLLFQKVAVKG